jgi:TonB-linked SusC/RagA family outer membrane protein
MRTSRFASAVTVLCLLVLGWPASADAQDMQMVTGEVVSSETMQPLPGVQVSVRGTRIGTLTDATGRFSLRVPADATTLVFTTIGFRTEEMEITGEPVRVELSPQAIGLEGLVVTALGVQREKRSLGYSVQDVSGTDISSVPEVNVINSLQGQVAGVNVTNAGPTGGTARVIIRGSNSLTGDNQPLIVVDGMPIDNSAPRNFGYGGIDYGNAASDINQYDIESISVLKGPNAAALYGSRAANGAIVITTKSGHDAGSSGLGLSATVSYTAETPLRLPNYQNEYGQGLFGEFQWVDGEGGGLWDFVDESWGPKLDGRPIDQFTGPQQPWVAHPDNVQNFFRTGQTLNTNVAVSRSTASSNIRLSVSNMALEGMSPGNDLDRTSIALKGGAGITDRLSADAALNYINQEGFSRPGTGYDEDNPMQQFIWFGRQVDINALRDYRCDGGEVTPCINGGQFNWNYNYHNNPFWEALVNTNEDQRDRLIGHLGANFQVNDWMTLNGRVGQDWYRDRRKRIVAPYSLDDAGDGSFGAETLYRSELNARLLASVTREVMTGLTLDASAGAEVRRNDYEGDGVAVARLTVPGIYTIDNAAVTPDPWDYETHQEVRSLLGTLTLNYGGYLNVDLTGRNDWSSTLPEGNNSYFYPSVSGAFVFSDVIPESDILSSGKIRLAWSRVGADADPYQLALVYNAQQAWGGTPLFAVPNELPNLNLKPEQTTSSEFGVDLGFFNERLGFVLTRYQDRTEDQIMPVQVSAASGYTGQVLNAGAVENWGWELLLRTTPVRSGKFQWDMTVNWSTNESEVAELYGDLKTLVLGSYWSLNIEARQGEPYGTMYGNPYLREDLDGDGCGDPSGELLLTDAGMPRQDPCRQVLGNYNPDWIGGIQQRFSYGPFDLSVLVDGQKGGDIFSVTNWFGEYAGVLESTLRGRENDFCDPGIIVDGLLPDGTRNTTEAVCPQSYFGRNYGIHEASIDDASYIKLREVRLGYELPSEWVGRLGFSGGNISFIGRNLALWSEIDNIDPETAFDASNVQGIEFGQFPSARSLGISVTVRP